MTLGEHLGWAGLGWAEADKIPELDREDETLYEIETREVKD